MYIRYISSFLFRHVLVSGGRARTTKKRLCVCTFLIGHILKVEGSRPVLTKEDIPIHCFLDMN